MKWKPILKILTLFLIGMAFGAFIMGGYVQQKMHRMHQSKDGNGFADHLVRITDAKGDDEIKIHQLGVDYGAKFEELNQEFMKSRVELFVALEEDGANVLDGEVKEKLLFHLDKMKKGPPSKRKGKKK